MSEDKWFFIIGCQRSGTTLMRLILESHSQILCYDESTAYAILGAGPAALRGHAPASTWVRLPAPDDPRLRGFKVPMLTEQLGDVRRTDTSSANGQRVYSGQRIIFMIRDVRDTVASMFRLRVGGGTWFDRFGAPAIETNLLSEHFRQRYASALAMIAESGDRPLNLAALYWRWKVESLKEYIRASYPVLTIRYEDLVLRPSVNLPKVCHFLGVDWEEVLLRHDEAVHDELVPDGLAIGRTNPRKPIGTESIAQWRRFMTDEQSDSVLAIAGPMQQEFYSSVAAQ